MRKRDFHLRRLQIRPISSAKNINKIEKGSSNTNVETRAKKVEEAYKDAANAKPGSITAKANLVKAFDERNKKK